MTTILETCSWLQKLSAQGKVLPGWHPFYWLDYSSLTPPPAFNLGFTPRLSFHNDWNNDDIIRSGKERKLSAVVQLFKNRKNEEIFIQPLGKWRGKMPTQADFVFLLDHRLLIPAECFPRRFISCLLSRTSLLVRGELWQSNSKTFYSQCPVLRMYQMPDTMLCDLHELSHMT